MIISVSMVWDVIKGLACHLISHSSTVRFLMRQKQEIWQFSTSLVNFFNEWIIDIIYKIYFPEIPLRVRTPLQMNKEPMYPNKKTMYPKAQKIEIGRLRYHIL